VTLLNLNENASSLDAADLVYNLRTAVTRLLVQAKLPAFMSGRSVSADQIL
jgi:hypothetical protein